MIFFFCTNSSSVIAVKAKQQINDEQIKMVEWLFGDAQLIKDNNSAAQSISGWYIGPRREMITPWSTTAVEITQNMNIDGIERIEEFFLVSNDKDSPSVEYDKMLQRLYNGVGQDIFNINKEPEPVIYITDFETYNQQEGLALNKDEIEYLKNLSKKIGRGLTDSEVFGFSQVNSEHCRHKIFNGVFIIDGKEMESSLFKMIKKTSNQNPNLIISAYKDNCAFLDGPEIDMFHPTDGSKPSLFIEEREKTVISLKAETHNFPTTVEPFNGAATGSGGEIRDRIAGGKGSFPIAGTACYMTSYPRFTPTEQERNINNEGCNNAMEIERDWEKSTPREWLYQTPREILTKASNGASDFGNKFGQSIICGSLLTSEFDGTVGKYAIAQNRKFGYDKVIMLAGGVGYAKKRDALKESPTVGDKVVLLGGDNYRIGMGGGAVSSVDTGVYANAIELNAIQRSNPEMQKRAYNAIRAIAESSKNTIISVHDHGAGGHLNCLSELVEESGGTIDISKLPIGDPTLSLKEIIGNESQERMGLVMKSGDVAQLKAIAERERAPMYVIGEATGEHNFTLKNLETNESAIDLQMEDMFGSAPKTYMEDSSWDYKFTPLEYDIEKFGYYLGQVLQIEGVACKDWLTNKVDRSVTGLIAKQQTCGEIQLPLNNLGATAIGYNNKEGIATSMGHAPLAALIDSAIGSKLAISESLTNLVWAPLKGGIKGVSLSANWMWPCRNKGEDARLYNAVKGASDFACALQINIPTGKDSMSMTQKYPNGEKVLSPGTLIVSTVAPVEDINKIVSPNLKNIANSLLIYIPFNKPNNSEFTFNLGGSAFAQIISQVGDNAPDINCPEYFANCFNAIQELVKEELILAGHDISAGGLITTALEMCFANKEGGLAIEGNFFSKENDDTLFKFLFAENPGVLVQIAADKLEEVAKYITIHHSPEISNNNSINGYIIGSYIPTRRVVITNCGRVGKASLLDKSNNYCNYKDESLILDIDKLRDIWFKTSYLFDIKQVGLDCAKERFKNYKEQPLIYQFPKQFTGKLSNYTFNKRDNAPVAAIIREKGSNGDREMAWALYLAGFRVKDVHMTDLISGRENLEEVNMIVFVGGFSNADTLGSAKGWAGAFLYNQKAKSALDNFYAREDTLSLGICNGCQLMAELGLITPQKRELSPKMVHNTSHKYESAFVGVTIEESPSIMLKSLTHSKLGIWVAHGEGKFSFPKENLKLGDFNIAVRYTYNNYPANPNGSIEGIAGVCSTDGRHLAMMPHPERCLRPWNWAHYPTEKKRDEITPWIEMFINARVWIEKI